MVPTTFRSKVLQWTQYVHLHMPTFSWANLKNFSYTLKLETLQYFTVNLYTTLFTYGMDQNRN